MLAELGTFALILALCFAVIQTLFPLVGLQVAKTHFVSLTRAVALGQFFFIGIAFGLLVYLFVTSDFSVSYVAHNSNTRLPLIYKVSAVWGAHEGSLVLWALCLSLWTAAVCFFSRRLPEVFVARILGVMGLIAIGFLLFILMTSNPFTPLYYDVFKFDAGFFAKLQQVVAAEPTPEFLTLLGKYELVANQPVGSKHYGGGTGAALREALLQYQLGAHFTWSKFYFTAGEGKDLNVLLQDFGLAVHPPLLYMGYVGLAVAFSFAIAALLGGKLDSAWARWSRPWTTIAWVFLTIGITLGSWWAYYELGWGGWWDWDPVENASFMPWLLATALIHSLAVTEKRGAFQSWTVMLAILAFSHSLLGTFLVRSGVLNSVHSFTTDPARGLFILIFLGLVVGSSLILYAIRASTIKSTGKFHYLSREGFLLANNIILFTVTITVLWGTLYPIINTAFDQQSIAVKGPWFNFYFVKLMLVLAVLAGIGPLVQWKEQDPKRLARRLAPYLVLSLLFGAALYFWMLDISGVQPITVTMALIISVSIWIVLLIFEMVYYRYRKLGSLKRTLVAFKGANLGLMVAHCGVAVFIVGATFVSYNSEKQDQKISPGESYTLRGYEYKFKSAHFLQGPNYNAYQAKFEVFKGQTKIADLDPERRFYLTQKQTMTEAGIDAGFTRDLYISPGDPLHAEMSSFIATDTVNLTPERIARINQMLLKAPWTFTLYHRPFIRWIWLGALMMALGGLIAATDKRYRLAPKKYVAQPA